MADEPSAALNPLFVEKLASSGLDPSDAVDLGIYWEDAAPSDFPYQLGGMRIPYFDPVDGSDTGFFRFRYLEELPRPKTGFAALVKPKMIRYAQPVGTMPRVYFPRVLPWDRVLSSPGEPIIITEGELKACCAARHGFICLGLGGVWSWKARARGKEVLDDLLVINWTGRTVRIVFDSDAIDNPKILAAENHLANALSNLGAVVQVIRLPKLEDGKKIGLDDFLLHGSGGPEALKALLRDTPPWLSFAMLHKLNEEVTYIRSIGRVYTNKTRVMMRPDAFTQHAYAPWRYMDLTVNPPKERSAPEQWIKWSARAEVEDVTFAPGQPERIGNKLNTWEGWGCEPVAGDVSVWKRLLQHLFDGDETKIRWFEQWCAYPLQNPGTKLYTACLLWGLHKGTGKTAVAYMLGKIHGSGFIEIKNKDLRSGFNGWAANRTLIYGDEITANDSRVDADWLKGVITQHNVRINEKFQVPYVLPDCANYLFSSNHPDALFIEDGDRRYFVHQVTNEPLPQVFYEEMDDWMHHDGGPSALFHYLLTSVDMSGFAPRARALHTADKDQMVEAVRSDIGSFVAMLKANPAALLTHGNHVVKLLTSQDILDMYDPYQKTKVTANGVAREMTRQGFYKANRGNPIRCGNQQLRVWIADPLSTSELIDASPQALADIYRDGQNARLQRKF